MLVAICLSKRMRSAQNCSAIQQEYSIIRGNDDILCLCEEKNLASINRSPLGMGLLSGKFSKNSQIPKGDVRSSGFDWCSHVFVDGSPNEEALRKLDAVRDILTSNGRTLAQGALAWIWGRSKVTIPIPGFKTEKQIEENARAMEFGPLTPKQMKEIDMLLGNK